MTPSTTAGRREAAPRTPHRRRISRAWFLLAPLLIFALFPLFWMAAASLKPPAELYRFPPTWIPQEFSLDYYRQVLGETSFLRYMANSLIVAVASTVIVTILSAMAGYGLARGRFPLRRLVTRSVLLAYLFPTILFVIPLFTLISGIGQVGTFPGIIAVHVAFNFPFCAWLMIHYFETLPREIEEAGRVDGLSNFGVFLRIALPLSGPGLATAATFGFINSWNEFLLSLVILGGGENRTLPVGVYNLVGSEAAQWGPLMAATTMTIVPTLVVFLFAQRKIVGGLTGGAVK